jgi:hypothetical protein
MILYPDYQLQIRDFPLEEIPGTRKSYLLTCFRNGIVDILL